MTVKLSSKLSSKKRALEAARLACDKKAGALSILHIGKLSSVADYLVICSGESERQVKAIASNVEENMKKKKGLRPLSVEGFEAGRWVLIDYGDVVVHVFYEPVRLLYDLEGLWADAPRIEAPPEAEGAAPAVS